MSEGWSVQAGGGYLEVDGKTLALTVRADGAVWRTADAADEVTVSSPAGEETMPLAAAGRKEITPYRSGTARGFRIDLAGLGRSDAVLTVVAALDLDRAELTVRLAAREGQSAVRRVRWPGPVQQPAGGDQTTVLPLKQGLLLPSQWGGSFEFSHNINGGGAMYMPWWGQCGPGASFLTIVDTPADASAVISHSQRGPTRVSVQWDASLGRFAYARALRMLFLPGGGFVELAKAYRADVRSRGRLVGLAEKIARTPALARVIGCPVIHTHILFHIQPESRHYKPDAPGENHRLVTFFARAEQLRALRRRGLERAYVHLDGWGRRGYDNLHPDVLPPCPEAGGWEGLRGLAETCRQWGYILVLHDQYRDYFHDADSFDPRHAVVDEHGRTPEWAIWFGGRQSLLCASLAGGYVRRNYDLLERHGAKVDGAYLDVFASVDPDECFSPEHPMTRAECLVHRCRCFGLIRSRGGIISSEEPMDFAIPHIDLVHWAPYAALPELHGRGEPLGVPVPLLSLVYHDSLLVPWMTDNGAHSWGPADDDSAAHAALNGSMPYLPIDADDARLARCRRLAALHEKVGMQEMVAHELLDPAGRRRRSAFADGTVVEADLDTGEWTQR